MMEIAIVGTSDFALGFQLAGINNLHTPQDDEEYADTLRGLLKTKEVGIIVVDSEILARMPERLKIALSNSVSPTVLGIGTGEDNTLREQIRKAIGVDLWK
jgi:V/A-type H+-transporting ATPase subunit F